MSADSRQHVHRIIVLLTLLLHFNYKLQRQGRISDILVKV
jgi:hypothetical protein